MSAVDMLLNCIVEEIDRGTKHFNSAGKLLDTPQAVLRTIAEEGGVYFNPVTNPSPGLSLGGDSAGLIQTTTNRRSTKHYKNGIQGIWLRGGCAFSN